MSDLQKIPTVPFDAGRHVLTGREQGTGKSVWFSLESVSEAERVYEQGQTPNLTGYVTKDELDQFRDVIVKAVSSHVPPAQLSAETTELMAHMGQAIVQQKHEIAELRQALADMVENFKAIQEKWGAV